MKAKYSPHYHLLAALICFAAAAVLNLYVLFVHPKPESAGKEISTKVNTALSKAQRDMNRVQAYLATDSVSFHDLLKERTYYPTFIFKKNAVIFWTNHSLVPELNQDLELTKPRVIENKSGKFLVSGTKYNAYNIQVYVPLEKQYGINNRYLQPGLNKEIFGNKRLRVLPIGGPTQGNITYKGRVLFSVENLEKDINRPISNAAMAVVSLGLFFLIWGLIRISKGLVKENKAWQATLLLVLPLLAIRLILLYYNFPFAVIDLDAFDPRLYAASFWAPSIGDLILNALLLLLFTIHVNSLFRKKLIQKFIKTLSSRTRLLMEIGCGIAFYLLLLGMYFIYYTSFSNSLLVMDITQSLHFSFYKILLYTAFIIHNLIFLILAHLLMQVFYLIHQETKRKYWHFGLAGIGIVCIIVGSVFDKIHLLLLSISLLFYLIVIFIRFKKNISVNPFQNYLFIFWIIAISAVTGGVAIYEHYLHDLLDYKQKFGSDLIVDRDIQGEYLIEDIVPEIQKDKIIKSKISDPVNEREFIEQKIIRYYLRDYFDRYETTVKFFNAGDSLANQSGVSYSLNDYKKSYLRNAIKTERKNLYLIKDEKQPYSRKYIQFFNLTGNYGNIVTVVLEMNLKKLMPNSVIPELLVDQKFLQPLYSRSLSYAIYVKHVIQYNEGNFEYVHYLDKKDLQDQALYTKGIRVQGYHHLGVSNGGEKVIVISTSQYSLLDVASNFSFLFLIHTFIFLVYMLAFLLLQGGLKMALNTNFSTKIQLFLNFGILIPLVIVSIATASLVTASYKKDLQDTYEKRGKLVQENILHSWSWATHETNKEALREEVGAIADLSEADINVYNKDGNLITSSQPLIFEAGLLSRLMNPEALADIKENNAQRILLKEHTGNISFNTLYLPLPSVHQNGGVDGFVGIPFFDSEQELDVKLIQLLTTIMNIFTAMFIIFMVLTNWAARTLTVPLKLITQKLKQTTLTGKNEKLEYHSADEIGLLVNEYNQMLLKLEESKKELALREKEAAWREMARQVAHEIKNPLTPMKLSLQYLQKAIAERRDNLEELINKISKTLITQIEILSDIATSFSNFTALPDLKPERLNIINVLKQSLDLHKNPAEVEIRTDLPAGTYEVLADENILMRSFNNLIINAVQAVPSGRKPELQVRLQSMDSKVLISLKDNGSGVPEEIRHKIFVPNFSTKFTGSGIGLALVKKGIEAAGGRIWFETEEGVSTTFYIELPLVQE
ncbi:sensor histidine kinase [Adhaeribacter aquaticus]|uniref:sensor histidine kinase n=1 Tax=Adhaeribacter aquaticus TaxID=299567 RepID=UPI0003FAB691|nr:HAMP domain-containing sensor histidine kinase [Adhaeribacter aquaticus]